MNFRRFLFTSLAVLAGGAALFTYRAVGQNPYQPEIRYETQDIIETLTDGRVVRRTVSVPVVERALAGSAAAVDAQSQKLLAEERALAQEVRRLSGNLQSIEAPEAKQVEWKSQIREKLAAIFDLQQQRRTHEIAKIEERLGKLKDVLKKRESAKDSIVDRRLESLTGGVDELGWEESLPEIRPTYDTQPNYSQQPSLVPFPPTAPRAENPLTRDPFAAPPAELPGSPVPVPPVPAAPPRATAAPPVPAPAAPARDPLAPPRR